MIEEAINSRLAGYAGLSALVSTRVYPVIAAQGATLPYIVHSRISGVRESAMGSDTGVARTRVQVSSYGSTYSSAKNVAKQARLALQRYSGTIGSDEILAIFVENDIDLYEEDTRLYHVATDYLVSYRE